MLYVIVRLSLWNEESPGEKSLLEIAESWSTRSWHQIRQPHIREYEAGDSGANFTSVDYRANPYVLLPPSVINTFWAALY